MFTMILVEHNTFVQDDATFGFSNVLFVLG